MIETKRLTLRKITLSDASFISTLVNTPGWLQFIGDRKVSDEASAKSFIKSWAITRYNRHGYGPYLLLYQAQPIGVCGLFKREHLDYPDLGFALMPEYMGQSFAKESSAAVIEHARSLGFEKLYAITIPENHTSQGLLLSLGFIKSEKKQESENTLFELFL